MALPKPKGIQLEVLDLKPIGHNVVLGTAGSGKTTLAIYRAIGLANYSPKEFIDYYKEKWKKYRITKKQMEMAYKLLMK